MRKAIAGLAVGVVVASLLAACGPSTSEEVKAFEGRAASEAVKELEERAAVPAAQVAEGSKGSEDPEASEVRGTFRKDLRLMEEVPKPDFKVTAVQYWFPYNKDESAAEAKFRDKSILLSGPMVEVSADSEPAYLVVRGANAKQLVKCTFDPQTVPDNLSRYKERWVKVLGLGDGKSEEYVHLRGCSVFEVIISSIPR